MTDDTVTCGRCGASLDDDTEALLRHLEQHGIDWTKALAPDD